MVGERSGHQLINKSNIDNQTRGADERIDQGEEVDAYAEEGVPEEVERHPRADEEEEGDLGGPRGGRRSGGRDAQERLGAEQRHEEEQEGERRGEADAEAGPRAAADDRREQRRHGRRPLHRHLRARSCGGGGLLLLLLALAAGLRGIQKLKGGRRGGEGGRMGEERTSVLKRRRLAFTAGGRGGAGRGVACVAFRGGRAAAGRRRVGETVTGCVVCVRARAGGAVAEWRRTGAAAEPGTDERGWCAVPARGCCDGACWGVGQRFSVRCFRFGLVTRTASLSGVDGDWKYTYAAVGVGPLGSGARESVYSRTGCLWPGQQPVAVQQQNNQIYSHIKSGCFGSMKQPDFLTLKLKSNGPKQIHDDTNIANIFY